MIFYLVLACCAVRRRLLHRPRARRRPWSTAKISKLHSLPGYHGMFLALFAAGPAAARAGRSGRIVDARHRDLDHQVAASPTELVRPAAIPQVEAFVRDARAIAFGGLVGFTDADQGGRRGRLQLGPHDQPRDHLASSAPRLPQPASSMAYARIAPAYRARHVVERIVTVFLIVCSVVAILTTVGIVLSLIFESLRFFQQVPFFKFLFGLHWSPQSAFTGAGTEAGAVNAGHLRRGPAVCRHAADHLHRHARRRADRPHVGDLPFGLCVEAAFARWSSRCWKSSPASRPSSTASSPR